MTVGLGTGGGWGTVPAADVATDTDMDRRTFLRSAGFLAAVVAVGSPIDDRVLAAGVEVTDGWLRSEYLPGQELRWHLAVPRACRGLVLALHGRGSTSNIWFSALGAARIARETGLAIAAVDGRRSYWHPRSGSDAPSMLRLEFLPLLAELGLPINRIGLTGISMGGFGCFYLAGELGPKRVVGVATMCAALRQDFAKTSSGAYDDASDFARTSIFARLASLRDIPLWMACGTADRFFPENVALARELPHAVTTFDLGGHTTAYCRAHWGPGMAWMADRFG